MHTHIAICRTSLFIFIYNSGIRQYQQFPIKTMPSGLLPLFFTCTPHPRHLLHLKLVFSTKLHPHCLHLTRLCGLCHHSPLSNSGNVSGHHLAGSNKTGCWSSVVSFVASFSSVQFYHPCHLSSYTRLLYPLIWT